MRTVALRLWLPLIVLTLTTVLIGGLLLYETFTQANHLKQDETAKVQFTMIRLQRLIEEALKSDNLSLIEQEISTLAIYDEVALLTLINPDATVQFATRYAWKNKPVTAVLPDIPLSLLNGLSVKSKPELSFNPNTLKINAYYPIRYPQPQGKLRDFPYGLLYVSYDLSLSLALIWYDTLNRSGLVWLGFLLIMLFFNQFLRLFITIPVGHLTEVMRSFAQNIPRKSELSGNGELTILGNTFNQLMQELTETQQQLERQQDLYAILSDTNRLIIHTQSEQQLFDDICQLSVKHQHLTLAWIGVLNPQNQLEVRARASAHGTDLDKIAPAVHLITASEMTIGIVLHEQRPVINNHYSDTPLPDPWQQIVRQQNIHAGVSFPITKFGHIVGTFNLYANKQNYFTADVMDLLNEMTRDVSFALENIELEQRREQAELEIERLAYYDSLTCLPNRRLLSERLGDEIAAAKRHHTFGALLFLDLDYFKNLNDTLGHAMGDELLIQLAKRLKNQLRQEDMAARLGGDEFVILLADLSDNVEHAIDKARKVTEKLFEILHKPYQLQGHHYHSSSSVGIALFPQEQQDDAEAVLKQADIALYRAKDAGRNTFQFYRPEMQETAYKRLALEKNLRDAIEQSQLQLYYHPQTNHLNQMVGAETLLRWQHPSLGFIPPLQFVPIAEEIGLIVEIGYWIFEHSFAQIKIWQDSGLLKADQHISINVSPKQFKQENLFEYLSALIAKTGVNPSSIILEVTEGTFLTNVDSTIEKMLQLRSLGFTFSIDDFGTGYSSLAYLKRLPLNELKIDKAFVDDIHDDADDRAIIETIIAMAEHFKLSVIAEGVETQEQLDFLKQQGCFNYQGYFFSKPLNKADFEAYMQNHNQC